MTLNAKLVKLEKWWNDQPVTLYIDPASVESLIVDVVESGRTVVHTKSGDQHMVTGNADEVAAALGMGAR